MRRSWISITALILLSAPVSSQSADNIIRLSRIAGFPDQVVGGEILTAACAKLGIKVELEDVPAERALVLSNSGQVDGEIQRIAGVEKTYTSLVPIPVAINYIEPSVFTVSQTFTVDGWESIRPYSIGIVHGVGSSERGTKGMPRVEAVGDQATLLNMLDHGHIDIAVTDVFSGQIAVKKLHLENRVHALQPPLQRIYLYHYLNDRHRDLAKQVEEVLRAMEADGELARLRETFVKQALEIN